MANKGTKISEAIKKTSLTGTELFPISDGSGSPKAVSAETIKGFIGGGGGSSVNVVDNLDSTSPTDALSANQGRELGKRTDELERKDGIELIHIVTQDESIEWGEHYSAGDGIIEITENTPTRVVDWQGEKTLHVENFVETEECHNELTIYTDSVTHICFDDSFEVIGDFISPDTEGKKVYSIQDGIIVCGEVKQRQ